MDILVTGGAGFIGGHLAEQFVRDGYDVVVLDNFDPYYDVGLKEHNVEVVEEAAAENDGSCRVVDGDIRDRDLVGDLVDEADYVYHHAAQAGVRTDYAVRKYHEVNVDGTLNVEDGEGDVVPHTINGVAYLDRVQPYGGGFTAWPGSHRDVCRYVADHPIQSVQGGIRAPDGEGGWDETRSRDEVFDPLELTGDPGTVVLWHGRLEHEGGINLRPGNVRMAHIKRFFHEDAWEMQERAPEEPYLGWDAMAGVVGDDYRI